MRSSSHLSDPDLSWRRCRRERRWWSFGCLHPTLLCKHLLVVHRALSVVQEGKPQLRTLKMRRWPGCGLLAFFSFTVASKSAPFLEVSLSKNPNLPGDVICHNLNTLPEIWWQVRAVHGHHLGMSLGHRLTAQASQQDFQASNQLGRVRIYDMLALKAANVARPTNILSTASTVTSRLIGDETICSYKTSPSYSFGQTTAALEPAV